MAATKAQQIGIWIIAVVLTVGTVGGFLAAILTNKNNAADTAAQQAEYNKQLAEYTKQAKAQAQQNADNSEALEGYSAAPFNGAAVTSLQKQILVAGTGDEVKATDTVNVSYFGWKTDGVIFDSSKKKGMADAPVSLSLSQVIKGWTDGLSGQRVGSVVKLVIPSDEAYGAQGSGIIPANEPLTFIIKINAIEPAASS